jgi:valyl-tRNA synthetase
LSAIQEHPATENLKFDKDFMKNLKNDLTAAQGNTSETQTSLTEQDAAIYKEWRDACIQISLNLEAPTYKIHLAAEGLYHYVWHTFADQILEASKPILKPDFARHANQDDILTGSEKTIVTDAEQIIEASQTDSKDIEEKNRAAISRAQTLLTILREILLTTHPFMPHITQEIWSLLPEEMHSERSKKINGHAMIAIEQWPLHS